MTERELLIIVKNLKVFRTIILGNKLRIYTDYKKIHVIIFHTDRLLRCILILKEYVPDIEYIKGDKNIVADTLSRFTLNYNQETT